MDLTMDYTAEQMKQQMINSLLATNEGKKFSNSITVDNVQLKAKLVDSDDYGDIKEFKLIVSIPR